MVTIVDPRTAATVRAAADGKVPGRRDHSAALAAMLAGDMVHFDDERQRFNRKAIATRHPGRRLRLRSDGEGGRFYWLEEVPDAAT